MKVKLVEDYRYTIYLYDELYPYGETVDLPPEVIRRLEIALDDLAYAEKLVEKYL